MLSLVGLYSSERDGTDRKINHSKSFQFKNKIGSSASTDDDLKVVLIKVLPKYLLDFIRKLGISLINFYFTFVSICCESCIISNITGVGNIYIIVTDTKIHSFLIMKLTPTSDQ